MCKPIIPENELVGEAHLPIRPKYEAIDMHCHFGPLLLGESYESGFDTLDITQKLKAAGIARAVCLELVWGDKYERLLRKLEPSDGFIVPFGSVDISAFERPDFEKLVYRQLRHLKSMGCKGIKLWKNITLYIRDSAGKALRLDDERLGVVWAACADEELPIVIHVADPPCFFKPIDEKNELFICLTMHPEWSFYGTGSFTFEEHMDMQQRVIAQNPKTQFIVAHVGSRAENLGQVGEWLDMYPNMNIDISARIDQLGRQPYTAKAFFDRYQDRILFGTDFEPGLDVAPFYTCHYRFLETKDEYFEHPFRDMLGQWNIYGLGLGDAVLEKVYSLNAKRLLKL